MERNTEKKPWTDLQNSYKNWSKEIKSDNFCYRKVGRAITKWGSIEKSPILLSQYWKNYYFYRIPKIISHFDGSNNIFADCIPVVDTTKEAAEIESCPVVVVVVLLLVVVVVLLVVVVVFALVVVVFALVVVVFALDFLGRLPNIEKSILGLIWMHPFELTSWLS